MKKFVLFLLFPLISFSQVTLSKTYKSDSGRTFSIGDTLKLGVGSKANKEFAYVYHQTASTALSVFNDKGEVGTEYALQKIIIQDFKVKDKKTYLVFYKSKLGIKLIDIEPAIFTKELLIDSK